MTTALVDSRGAPAFKANGTGPGRPWLAVLRVPLLGKVVGANLFLVVAFLASHTVFPDASTTWQLSIMMALSFLITTGLVWLALRPIAGIEETAGRVSDGDFSARVPASILADRDALRLSNTMNRLLERVEADRARIQYLAGRSVRARDIEREAVSRELRDSLAQMLSAISLQVAAAKHVNENPEVEQQLERARTLLQQLTEEMRGIAETLYPGTLAEFGLPNALQALARRTQRQASVTIDIDTTDYHKEPLAPQAASALYRAADEALRNVARHADAHNVQIRLRSTGRHVTLQVEDDGRGLDMRAGDPLQAGLGLFSAKAVLALANGELQISSAPGLGTLVTASVPVAPTTTSLS